MKKCLFFALMLLTCCSPFHFEEHMPASLGKYAIDSVANEVGLIRLYPDAEHSGCGLAHDDFIEYAMNRIDYSRQFQFIVFINGKPLVGERCLRKAFIFYLK